MATWDEFAKNDPDLAALGEERFNKYELVIIGTTRKDGSARVSPIEFGFWEGDLWLGMMPDSNKRKDVDRDPRITVHNAVANKDGKDGEFKVIGRVVPATGERLKRFAAHVKETSGFDMGDAPAYAVDIDRVWFIRYDEKLPPPHQEVRRWPR